MFCQTCGAANPDDQEFCRSCQHKLLVVSGAPAATETEFQEQPEGEAMSLDEHLLERISILEEAVKRTAETVRHLLAALNKQERSILVHQTGLSALRDLLQRKRLIGGDEWSDLWESKMEYQLLALEKRERFVGLRERIAALYQGGKRKLFAKLLEDAEHALFAFDLERALAALEAAYKLDRENYELALFIGETYFNEGDTTLAMPYFDRVLEVRADHYEGLVYSGVIHHERGDSARAEDLLKRAVALYPDAFLPHFSLGAVYAGIGNLARAVVLLEKAVALEPVAQALYLLGSSLYEMGRLTPAIRRLEEVVRHDPAYEEAYHLLGLAYLDRHWNRKALEAFRQAQRLNPRRMRYRDLVRYLSGKSELPLPRVGKKAGDWLARAEDYLARDSPERSVACYRKAIDADPENPTLLLSYALACLQLNRSKETESVARRILEMEPGEMLEATACATLIEALRSEGRLREGNRVGSRLLERGRSNFAKTIAYYEMAYNLAEMEEDLDRALDYAQRALELSPEELRQFPLAALGWVHYKRRELDQAVAFLSRASEVEPSEITLTHLGMALLAAGEEDRARHTLARAREIGGHSASLEQRMMECLRDSSRLLERVEKRGGK